jgi:hypothetical protein
VKAATLLAAALIFLSAGGAWADAADEIAHLIDAVRHSPCQFLRNGEAYAGGEAADHIAMKYRSLKDEIATAEDFIARAASRSLQSGRPYQIACPGEPTVPASEWLLARLRDLRN